MMDRLRASIRSTFRRLTGAVLGDGADEFRDELDSHIAMHVDDGVRAGLSPEEARRQALIRLGGQEQARQAYRDRRGLPWLEALARDLRHSLRVLAKHPAVTAIAILSIGLGIGANATIFAMVSRFVLRTLPVPAPATLLAISTTHKGDDCCNNFSRPVYEDVRAQAKSFAGIAAYDDLLPASIGGNGEPERVWGQAVTTNFFDVLELPMVLGRGFATDEDQRPMIVLGQTLWQRRFNGDAAILGKSILLSGQRFTVVGVAPAAFHSADQLLDAQFWVPLGTARGLAPNLPPDSARDYHWLSVIGRLGPGVSRAAALAELNTLAARFAKTFPATDKDNGFHVEVAGSLPPNMRQMVFIFLGVLLLIVLLVLSIAAANVANLLFAQAAVRQREMAVRLALGATRGQLRRQMLLESTLIAVSGGALGLLFSLWATRGLSALHVPVPVPLDLRIALDWRVLLFALGLSVVSGVLLGAAPAWAASRPALARALKGEDALVRPGRRWTLRNVLVVGQIAMSVIVLSLTMLFLRSLQSAAAIDIGFRPQNVLMLSVDPRIHNYSAAQTVAFLAQLRERAAALPGVTTAAVTDVAPLSGGHRSDGFTLAGHSASERSVESADLYMVSRGYFAALGMSQLAGHDFGNETATGMRTAVINRAFAERLFGDQNPLGQRVTGAGATYEVIGVVDNIKSRTIGEKSRPVLYRSLTQSIGSDPSMMGYTLVVRSAGDPAGLMASLRSQVYALDPAMAIYNAETMEEHVRTAYLLPRLAATLFGIFGGIGMVLAAVGIYGVMSYAVSRRTREIGIRMAMGAQPGTVERLILRQGIVYALSAIVLGWPAAWMLSKLVASLLYGVHPHDVLTFAIVPPFLLLIAVAACWMPARRAASVDPMQALRTE